MRVVFPAVLDSFACSDQDCPCRTSLRVALSASKPAPANKFPFREAEQALLDGAARLAEDPEAPRIETLGHRFGDYPILAVNTPQGVELSLATLCPSVRELLATNQEPVSLARAEGGWRVALQVFHPDGGGKDVRLTPRKTVKWQEFIVLREALLDLAAEPTLPLLARLARAASLIDTAIEERMPTAQPPPLTARAFLAFRGFIESRLAGAEAEPLARFAGRTLPLYGAQVGLTQGDVPALLDALAGEWRDHFRKWLVPSERDVTPAVEAYLGTRLFAIPLDRDQSLARAYVEFFEGFAIGLRYAAAIAEVRQTPVDPDIMMAALALGEFHVAAAQQPLPAFELPRDVHERGPRMADLDMTLESVC
jgi:hypothetical protein